MSAEAPGRSPRRAVVLSIVIAGVMGLGGAFLAYLHPTGTPYASSPHQQKGEEDSATGNVLPTSGTLAGTESLSDWVETHGVTKDFLRTLESRWQALRSREQELERRERHLELLRQDIEEKLQRLEAARAQLEAMTGKIDQSQKEELTKTVKIFTAMDPEAAAKILVQMLESDVGSVATILKAMDRQTAGRISDEMVTYAGTDSERLKSLSRLGDFLYRSGQPGN